MYAAIGKVHLSSIVFVLITRKILMRKMRVAVSRGAANRQLVTIDHFYRIHSDANIVCGSRFYYLWTCNFLVGVFVRLKATLFPVNEYGGSGQNQQQSQCTADSDGTNTSIWRYNYFKFVAARQIVGDG